WRFGLKLSGFLHGCSDHCVCDSGLPVLCQHLIEYWADTLSQPQLYPCSLRGWMRGFFLRKRQQQPAVRRFFFCSSFSCYFLFILYLYILLLAFLGFQKKPWVFWVLKKILLRFQVLLASCEACRPCARFRP